MARSTFVIFIICCIFVAVPIACSDDDGVLYSPSGDSDVDGDANMDCFGVPGGAATHDACGVCDGDGSTCDCSAGSYCEQMVLAHNGVRQGINDGTYFSQPLPASPIPDLTWDPLLAQVALEYASLCDWAHNANRQSDYADLGGQGSVGENIAASTNERTPEQVVLNQWADEVVNYDYAANSCSGVCGHYTQVVWANTERVGCAVVHCGNIGSMGSGWYTVCNYTPAGNFNNEQPY